VLVPEHNADELARALINAAQNPEFLSRIGRAGADAVAQKFDQRIQIQRLEDIYLRMIGMAIDHNRPG
jgi:glycosyltransferase involved in cell wall biosynthesis